jgi:hypothetical protein
VCTCRDAFSIEPIEGVVSHVGCFDHLEPANLSGLNPADLGDLCQNMAMARGWESKDVEAQVVDAPEVKKSPSRPGQKSREEQLREQAIRDLKLSRTRITNDLATATNANHRKSLEAALAHLDQKIAELS